MHKLDKLLKDRAEKFYVKSEVPSIEVGLVLLKVIRKYFDETPDDVTIAHFKSGCLTLNCKSPYVISRLKEGGDELKKELNDAIGEGLVNKLQFRLS